MKTALRRNILFTVMAVISVALDQWTKVLARTHLKPLSFQYDGKVSVIDNFFELRYSENSGVAFGMLQRLPGGRIILALTAIAALFLVVYYLRKSALSQTRLHIALGLVGGGAIGNLLDRIVFGQVTDFIVWRYHNYIWPTFNVADAALVVGVCLMALDMLLERKHGPATEAREEAKSN